MQHLNKSQKEAEALETAQQHVGLPCKRIITPVKTNFTYLTHYLHCLLENKGYSNYFYGLMGNTPNRIREPNFTLTNWSVTSTGLMTMRQIVGSDVKNQSSGGKWLISQSIVHTVRVYIHFCDNDMDEIFKVQLYQMLEDQDGLGNDINLRRNLEETQMKIR